MKIIIKKKSYYFYQITVDHEFMKKVLFKNLEINVK